MDDSMNDAFDYISDRHILEAAAPKKRHPVKGCRFMRSI